MDASQQRRGSYQLSGGRKASEDMEIKEMQMEFQEHEKDGGMMLAKPNEAKESNGKKQRLLGKDNNNAKRSYTLDQV